MGAMKKWRRDAAKFNAEAGEKHRGRANKAPQFEIPKYIAMSDLLCKLLVNARL